MGLLSWIILGGLAGWIASMIMKTNERMGLLANIAVGVVGALIGGFVFGLLGAENPVNGLNLFSLLVAVIGSVILLGIVQAFTNRKPV